MQLRGKGAKIVGHKTQLYEAIGQLLESGSVAFQVPEGGRTTGRRTREEVCAMTACWHCCNGRKTMATATTTTALQMLIACCKKNKQKNKEKEV